MGRELLPLPTSTTHQSAVTTTDTDHTRDSAGAAVSQWMSK